MVQTWVRNNDETGLLEVLLDLVSQRTRNETAEERGGSGVGGVLQQGALSDWERRDDANIGWVFNGSDGAGGQKKLFPGLAKVQQMNTYKQ